MIPVSFKEVNTIFAKDQPEYIPLPCHIQKDVGIVTIKWKLSIKERMVVLFKGTIWQSVLTFNMPLQPIKFQLDKPELH